MHRRTVDADTDVTGLIHRAQSGDQEAASDLLKIAYDDLHRLARARLGRSGRDVLLNTTVLVNEWFIRFAKTRGVRVVDRAHFLRYAAMAMRSIVVDFARRRLAQRRGAGAAHVGVTGTLAECADASAFEEIISVHEALDDLEVLDRRMFQIVQMRYFGGMTEEEIAESLGVCGRTVRRDWIRARIWLAEALG